MKFEQYKNTLIPIERVMWVEFDAKGDWSTREPRTLVHIFLPNGLSQAIEFKGNQVDKINEWLKQFPEAGSWASGSIPCIYTEEHRNVPDVTLNDWNTNGTDCVYFQFARTGR